MDGALPSLGAGVIRGNFKGEWYDIKQATNVNLSAPGGAFAGGWVPQPHGKHHILCALYAGGTITAAKGVEVTVSPRVIPSVGGKPPAALHDDPSKATLHKLPPGPTVQSALRVLGNRKAGADIETLLAFSKEGDESATIRTRTEPQMAADEVIVSGRSGRATVRVRGACAGARAGSTLHLLHTLELRYAFPGGGSVPIIIGTLDQRLPLGNVCGIGLPPPKSEGEKKIKR